MYGIINQSIQELVIKNFGEETWLKIISRSNLAIAEFENHELYDDEITYKLAQTIADVLETTLEAVLKLFGEFWILDISMKKYPSMMAAGGNNLKEFMLNLPTFHNRVFMTYPKLIAPEFKVHLDQDDLLVEYHSQRNGLSPLMEGMLVGIVKMFNEAHVTVELEKSKNIDKLNFDLFRIKWNQ